MEHCDHKRGSITHWENTWAQARAVFSLDDPINDWGYFDLFRCEYLEKLLLKRKDIVSLECGCGTAATSAYFANKGVRTVLLDTSASALKIAQENYRKYDLNGTFVNANMESMPFRDEEFDLVMSFGVLEHFQDMRPAIKEMVRVLKKNGVFFAAVSPRKRSMQIVGNFINAGMRFLYNIKHNRFKEAFLKFRIPEPGFFENSFSAKEYASIIKECGLKEVRISGSRPFPSLDLPRSFYKGYIRFMKILKPLHLFFETHPSRFTELLGAEYNIIAVKS